MEADPLSAFVQNHNALSPRVNNDPYVRVPVRYIFITYSLRLVLRHDYQV